MEDTDVVWGDENEHAAAIAVPGVRSLPVRIPDVEDEVDASAKEKTSYCVVFQPRDLPVPRGDKSQISNNLLGASKGSSTSESQQVSGNDRYSWLSYKYDKRG